MQLSKNRWRYLDYREDGKSDCELGIAEDSVAEAWWA